MTREEFENYWFPAVKLLARSQVHINYLRDLEEFPSLKKFYDDLSKEIDTFIAKEIDTFIATYPKDF